MSFPKALIAVVRVFAATMLLANAVCAQPASADTFRLNNGGQLEGIWLDSDQDPVLQYEIQLRGGGRIILAAGNVKEVIREPEIEQQYQRVVAKYGDDVEGHWAIAQWCRDRGLRQRRRDHLNCILRLDANHRGARLALGCTFVQGRWVTQEEFMRDKGYVRYKGHWELPQQVALLEERRKRETAERQWYRQLSHWRRELGTDRDGKFQAAIASVNDPLAIPAMVRLLERESLRPVQLLYVKTLSGISVPQALHALLNVALTHHDEEVVHACLDHLAENRHPWIHGRLLELLRHENNRLVNRAAVALSRLGEEEAVAALIDALITCHMVPRFNEESDEWELVPVHLHNPEVLAALTALTNITGYAYDKKAWKHWRFLQVKHAYAAQAKGLSVRRGKSND